MREGSKERQRGRTGGTLATVRQPDPCDRAPETQTLATERQKEKTGKEFPLLAEKFRVRLEGAFGVGACVGLEIPRGVHQVPRDPVLPMLGLVTDLNVLEAAPPTVSIPREGTLDLRHVDVADGSPDCCLVHGKDAFAVQHLCELGPINAERVEGRGIEAGLNE